MRFRCADQGQSFSSGLYLYRTPPPKEQQYRVFSALKVEQAVVHRSEMNSLEKQR